jgi:hypothetical protein
MKCKMTFRRCLTAVVAVTAVYLASYAILRLTKVLVTRSYLVFHYDGFGGETTVEHCDVGRGSAYGPHNKPQFHSVLGSAFLPAASIELFTRGKGHYPITWPKATIMDEMEANQASDATSERAPGAASSAHQR